MPPTTLLPDGQRLDQIRARIASETYGLDDQTWVDPVVKYLDATFARHAALDAYDPGLRDLYTTRDLIDLVAARLVGRPDAAADGQSIRWSQRLAGLMRLRAAVQADIDELWKSLAAARAPLFGTLTQTSPIMVPTPGAGGDPNAARLRGSPFGNPFFPFGW